MSRLTARTIHGHVYFPRCFEDPCNGSGCQKEQCEYLNVVCEKLAEYEDTELLPDRIREIDKLYSEKCRELAEERKKHEWIPCSERLPEMHREDMEAEGEYYMISNPVIVTDGNKMYVAEYEEDDGYIYGWHSLDGEDYENIIAWMPLPEPYRPDPCHGCFGAANNDCRNCDKI